MIKIERVVLASPEQMEFIIEGMRNPLNSWKKSDSHICKMDGSFCMECEHKNEYCLGKNDYSLMERLAKAGTEHRKYMRMIPVYARITAPIYYWKEADTYKIGTVSNSCSTMHKIQDKEFTLDDFSYEHLIAESREIFVQNDDDYPYFVCSFEDMLYIQIEALNKARNLYLETGDKNYWWQMIQLLPSSYNQTRNIMFNYEVLANIYKQRKNHKLDEWREFCNWIETLPYSELITGKKESQK